MRLDLVAASSMTCRVQFLGRVGRPSESIGSTRQPHQYAWSECIELFVAYLLGERQRTVAKSLSNNAEVF